MGASKSIFFEGWLPSLRHKWPCRTSAVNPFMEVHGLLKAPIQLSEYLFLSRYMTCLHARVRVVSEHVREYLCECVCAHVYLHAHVLLYSKGVAVAVLIVRRLHESCDVV